MMERVAEASPRRWARIAGGLYLSVIVGGFFAVGGQIQELDGDGDQHEGYHKRSIALSTHRVSGSLLLLLA